MRATEATDFKVFNLFIIFDKCNLSETSRSRTNSCKPELRSVVCIELMFVFVSVIDEAKFAKSPGSSLAKIFI